MEKETSLKIIAIIAFIGILFSGYLSYTEIFKKTCALGSLGTCTNVFSIPACVYGFVMYCIVLLVAILGIKNKQ